MKAGLKKIWHIAWFEYRNRTIRKSFLVVLFGFPIVIVFVMFFGVALLYLSVPENRPIGFVDLAGLTSSVEETSIYFSSFLTTSEINMYADETAAWQALDEEKIQAYFVIDPDYLKDGKLRLIEKTPLTDAETRGFSSFLADQINQWLIRTYDPDYVAPEFVQLKADEEKNVSNVSIFNLMVPAFAYMGLNYLLYQLETYLLLAFQKEKDSRTMEMLTSSVSLPQLFAGKLAGNLAAGLTIPALWGGGLLLLVSPLIQYIYQHWFLEWNPAAVLVTIVLFISNLLTVSALLVAMGAFINQTDVLKTLSVIVMFICDLPLALFPMIMIEPNGPVAVFFTFFPLAAMSVLGARMSLTVIPLPELLLACALQIFWLCGSFWLCNRLLRLSLYNYDSNLSLKKFFAFRRKGVAK
ncbi:MAG TPA: ABC transporter permease [Anaerolineaceae bacterium]|nr:ABC transporter permease [Anaerolineaceae bacterium]HPN51596.1 ABC transporter permease [Anaerolineaceae bacterium]